VARRPFMPGILDSTHMFSVGFWVGEKRVEVWSVSTASGLGSGSGVDQQLPPHVQAVQLVLSTQGSHVRGTENPKTWWHDCQERRWSARHDPDQPAPGDEDTTPFFEVSYRIGDELAARWKVDTRSRSARLVRKPRSSAAVGLWQIPPLSRVASKSSHGMLPGTHGVFAFDGQFVTVQLLTEKDWMWKSEDDVYKLEARWEGDALFYRPPFATWQYLATFQGDRFFVVDEGRRLRWDFRRICREDLALRDAAILRERKVHDYRIKPTDPRVPARGSQVRRSSSAPMAE